jgi:hypothetical protein
MSASLIGTGGYVALANTYTAASPAVLYDGDGTGGDTVKDDVIADVFSVTNHDDTNWVWVRVSGLHTGNGGCPIPPGEQRVFKVGNTFNNLRWVKAWATVPNAAYNGTAPSGSTNVSGSIIGSV